MERKTSTGLIVLVICMILIILGLSGYIFYDKVFNNNSKCDPLVTDNDKTTEEKTNQVFAIGSTVYYYNPITDTKCNNGENNCYGWYVITTNDTADITTIDVIMDKNIGTNSQIEWNKDGTCSDGAITALNYLTEQTADWKIKPRMISAEEVASIIGKEDVESSLLVELPSWLYINAPENTGYWTSTSNCDNGLRAVGVDARGFLSMGTVFSKSLITNAIYGVRPVITVSKDKLI